MRRRSFFSLTSSTVSATALGHSSAGSGSKAVSPKQPNAQPIPPVLANTDRTGEMHTMGYSSMAFKVLTRDSQGDLFMIEHHMNKRGGPPLHVHLHQDETFYVLEGEFIAEVGGKRFNLHPGDSVLAPRNVPHVWACVGDGTGKMIIAFTPAGKMEPFFTKVSATQAPFRMRLFFVRTIWSCLVRRYGLVELSAFKGFWVGIAEARG